ncbi:hypothetical protein ACOMHN_023325 [Nucella lapillus]
MVLIIVVFQGLYPFSKYAKEKEVKVKITGFRHFKSFNHYRCPGDFNDCLPVYTRCNGMYDCLDHQDEEGCEDLTCPGFFRCRVSTICVHNDHLCDGWSHCPLRDDELLCDVTCPVDCQGHTFLCVQPFSATLFPQILYLDATGSVWLRD